MQDEMYEDEQYQRETSVKVIKQMEDDSSSYEDVLCGLEENNCFEYAYEEEHDRMVEDVTTSIEDSDPLHLMTQIINANLPQDVKDEIYDEFRTTVLDTLSSLNNRILQQSLHSFH
jgi:hypothetical protein